MIQRHLTKEVVEALKEYPAVILTGPRRIGKTTLIEKLMNIKNLTHVSMDSKTTRNIALNQPNIFFNTFKTPLFIDEVQKAPSIFEDIKLKIDKNKKPGEYILTGSQKFVLMKHVSESLAGRAAIIDMQSLSQSEINEFENFSFISDYASMEKRFTKYKKFNNINIPNRIVEGSMPSIIAKEFSDKNKYYNNYLKSVLFKDIENDITKINNKSVFENFLKIIANYSGKIINKSNISRDISINIKTIDSWLNALEAIGAIFFLYPYSNNATKRITKSPKLYFYDTGLLCHLLNVKSSEDLLEHQNYGNIYETFVVSEISKSFINTGNAKTLYYLQDKDMKNKEIDVIIEEGNILYPIEIKSSSLINNEHFANISLLKNFKQTIKPMVVIGTSEFLSKIDENKIIFPAWML